MPFDLTDHEYLEEIYVDNSPERVFKKAAQIGMSTEEILRALWYVDQYVCKVIYYFPTKEDVEEFGQDRFDPLVQSTEYFKEMVQERAEEGGAYSKSLKQIGQSTVYMRGLWTRTQAKSVDADILTFDEVDEIKQDMMEFAKDRILHSSLGFMTQLSQPSVSDYGIDAAFDTTDKRYWHLKCPGCGEWNCLEENWKAERNNFIELTADQAKLQGRKFYRGCLKCGAELDMAMGEWVPKFPSRKERGYNISGLYTQIRQKANPEPADQIMKQFLKARTSKQKRRFQISIVGDTYDGENKPITDTVLKNCEGFYKIGTDAGMAAGMGVDVGDTLHIAVYGYSPMINRPRILWLESTENWDKLDEIWKLFWPQAGLIDGMPYKPLAVRWSLKHPNQIYLQFFQEKEKMGEDELDGEKFKFLHVDRTSSLDDTVEEFTKGIIEIPPLGEHEGKQLEAIEECHKHLKKLATEMDVNAKGQKIRTYLSKVPNHYGMAINSARIAARYLSRFTVSSGTLPVFGRLH